MGLKDLILKAEHELDLRSKIMKLIVHKIEIIKDGFEIHFRVGENHYTTALEEFSSNASFFVSFSDGAGKKSPKNKKATEVLASEALKSNLKRAQDFLHFHAIARSSRLTNGGLYWARTSDLFHVKETRYQLRQETIIDNCEFKAIL